MLCAKKIASEIDVLAMRMQVRSSDA